MKLTPDGHPDQQLYLHGLSKVLRSRGIRTASMDAQAFLKAVINSPSSAHEDPKTTRNNEAEQNSKDWCNDDLNAAAEAIEKALKVTPEGHPQRVSILRTFAETLHDSIFFFLKQCP